MMKIMKTTLLAVGFSLIAGIASAADKVTLQLKWVTQAQFAGYYVALDRGFYDAEDLDRHHQTRRPGNRTNASACRGAVLMSRVEWMPAALCGTRKRPSNGQYRTTF